ncbi:phospholipase A1 member A isoform X1 [Acipenser oxyrinchus oxyrinchus]|uniref:Phospholipase A1 member A n=1 Tax=Acipenser oxyrinchus oxyrinchus TaxID=40147 RepID=A0AAD8G7V9_ACIOX|nr:phospholipase A1 member A isoform X1 [Acipenser oxyrinchus oxyrinchus]
MAGIWKIVLTLLGLLVLCSQLLEGAEEDLAAASNCTNFQTTTWKQYLGENKLQVQYLIFTPRSRNCASIASGGSIEEIQATNFNSSLDTKVIILGYRALGNKPSWIDDLVQALLSAAEVNVLVVDWLYGASSAYNVVVQNSQELSVDISIVINNLIALGSTQESFHFIGVSLGAHVAGFVGSIFGGKLGRITGLDAAGPMFTKASTDMRLDPSDALFVEAIHTDMDNFGIRIPIGHIDYQINGGKDQPGCSKSQTSSIFLYFPVFRYMICDHMRAVQLYISAISNPCPLLAFPCQSYEDFVTGKCLNCDHPFGGSCPRIGLLRNGGITVNPLPKEVVFMLTTDAPPFCAHHILVDLHVTQLSRSSQIQVTLKSEGVTKSHSQVKLQKGVSGSKMVMAHSTMLCKIDSIELKNTGTRFYRKDEINIVKICISEVPSDRKESLCVENIKLKEGNPWSHDFVKLCN